MAKEIFNKYRAILGDKVYLRLQGDLVQTSHGAEFPAAHAKKMFPTILQCVQRGHSWQTHGHIIRLGDFHVERILSNGTVIAGCHTVEYDQVLRIAEQLGIFTTEESTCV